ncbi:MAG: lysozyme inhibitor LprI family protein [Rhodocyclaceae bacterium]
MRTIAQAALLALALTTQHAWAETILNDRMLHEECGWDSHASMRDCLARKAHETETWLRNAQAAALAAIDNWDEDARYRRESKRRFRAAERAFATYRATYCAFSASLGGGAAGGAHEMGRLGCVAILNSQHTAQLRSEVIDLPLK